MGAQQKMKKNCVVVVVKNRRRCHFDFSKFEMSKFEKKWLCFNPIYKYIYSVHVTLMIYLMIYCNLDNNNHMNRTN